MFSRSTLRPFLGLSTGRSQSQYRLLSANVSSSSSLTSPSSSLVASSITSKTSSPLLSLVYINQAKRSLLSRHTTTMSWKRQTSCVNARYFSTNDKDKENISSSSSNNNNSDSNSNNNSDNNNSSSNNISSNNSSSADQTTQAVKKEDDDLEDKYTAEEQAEMDKNNAAAKQATDVKDGEGNPEAGSAIKEADYDDYYEDEQPQTKEGRFRQGFKNASIWALILTGIGCIVYLGRTLIGKHSVNGLFSNATDSLKSNDEIREIVGDNMVAFGRDNINNQGRRNLIDSYEYETEDGDKRLRIRFHVEGTRTKLRCWAEVSSALTNDSDYAYLICQDMKTGRVITIQDNRQKIDDMKHASGNTSLLKAFDQLRSGGGQSS